MSADILATSGQLQARLASDDADIRASQELRYQVFYEEMSAVPTEEMARQRRDFDEIDNYCDHLLAVDLAAPPRPDGRPMLAGTYRLLRQDVAMAHGGFYTQSEFDMAPLYAKMRHGRRFLELGRSCTHKDYRNQPTIELLWKGVMAYLARHKLDVMFGCASFDGTNPDDFAEALTFLYHTKRPPEEDWRVHPVPERYVRMDRMPPDDVNLKRVIRAMPPLIRGYIAAGAWVGEGAVIDAQFGTTDVLILLPVENITAKFKDRFG